MKIIEQQNNTFNTLQTEANEFKIGSSGQKFIIEALSKTIYKNPIGTIIREYVSNAYDANREAGNEEPVLVDLATDANGTYLSVMDNGVGLSPDRITNVFCRYGESTKRDTNDQIGGFGIGAKSAFSYTDTFYINTIVEGTLYRYVLYKTSDFPKMQLIHQEPSELQNGTEIKLYIKPNDVNKFRTEIFNQLRYFDGVYLKNGNDFNDFKIYNNKTFKYSTQIYGDKFNTLHICLGKVAYPIDWDILKENVIYLPFALSFEIGDIPVTLSREEIQYDQETVNRLKKRILEFRQEIQCIYENNNFIFEDIKDFFIARNENPSIYFDTNRVTLKEYVKVIPCELKALKNVVGRIPKDVFFFFKALSRINEKGNCVKLHSQDKTNCNDIYFTDSSIQYYFVDEDVNNEKMQYLRSLYSSHVSIKLITFNRVGYSMYKKMLDLPNAKRTGKKNNVARIREYKELMFKEYILNIPVLSSIKISDDFFKQKKNNAKIKAEERKQKKINPTVSEIVCYDIHYGVGKGYKKKTMDVQYLLDQKHRSKILYCEKSRAKDLCNIFNLLGNRDIIPIALCNDSDIKLFQNKKHCIHIDDYKLIRPSKRFQNYVLSKYLNEQELNNDFIRSILDCFGSKFSLVNKIGFYKQDDFTKIQSKFYEKAYNFSLQNLISPELKSEIQTLKRYQKSFGFLTNLLKMRDLQYYENENIIKLYVKFGLFPSAKAYTYLPYVEWEMQLKRETENKIKYLKSLNK